MRWPRRQAFGQRVFSVVAFYGVLHAVSPKGLAELYGAHSAARLDTARVNAYSWSIARPEAAARPGDRPILAGFPPTQRRSIRCPLPPAPATASLSSAASSAAYVAC